MKIFHSKYHQFNQLFGPTCNADYNRPDDLSDKNDLRRAAKEEWRLRVPGVLLLYFAITGCLRAVARWLHSR